MLVVEQATERLERAYASGASGDPLAAVLLTETLGDEGLAELVFCDGRLRVLAGLPVELGRYLEIIPDLAYRSVPLDAAISVALRAETMAGVTLEDAEASIARAHPELAEPIAEAALLERVFASETVDVRAALGSSMPEVGNPFGPSIGKGRLRYHLLRTIGAGSTATVFLAEDHHLATPDGTAPLVAIKISRGRAIDTQRRYEVASEAARARSIEHPNILRIYDRGVTADGLEYIVTEFAPGGSLKWESTAGARADDSKRIAWAVDAGIEIARGLQAIHLVGLVHRDLKPDNILIGSDGRPKIADFGIALPLTNEAEAGRGLIDAPSLRGSLGFMAPERVRCEPGCNSVRADVYALGAILVYLMTGRMIGGNSVSEICRRAWNAPSRGGDAQRVSSGHAAPAIPRTLARVLDRCVAVNPRDRYESAGDVAADLERWKRRQPIPWIHTSVRSRASLLVARNPAISAVTMLGVFAVVVASIVVAQWMFATKRHNQWLQSVYTTLSEGIESLTKSRATGGLGSTADAMTEICAIEWMLDRSLLVNEWTGSLLGEARVAICKDQIRRAELAGRADDVETWQWRLAQGYFEARLPMNAPKQEGLLESVHEAFTRKLGPHDSLTRTAATMALFEKYRAAVVILRNDPSATDRDYERYRALHKLICEEHDRMCREDEADPITELLGFARAWPIVRGPGGA